MYFSRLQSEPHFSCWKLCKLSPFSFAYWGIVLDWSTHRQYGVCKRRKGSKDQRNQKRPKNEGFQSDTRVVAPAIVALPDQLPISRVVSMGRRNTRSESQRQGFSS